MLFASFPALAHVGSSPQTNNRYLTLVPEPGAVRLVYTLIFGESPGSAARRRMDGDGDGRLSPAERRGFSESIADVVAAGLDIELDGEPAELTWSRVDLGLGTTHADGGALSVDLSAVICTGGGGEHALRLTDGFRVPPVGEGALAVEPSGVEVVRSAMGGGDETRRAFKWTGAGPLAERGYELVVRSPPGEGAPAECAGAASAEEQVGGGGAPGTSPPAGRSGPGRGALAAGAVAVFCALAFAIAALRRRR